jgi:hypothetical protein
MGIRTVFTDHSLFSLDDATGILTNKLLAGALKSVDAVIGVSHTGYVTSGSQCMFSHHLIGAKIQSFEQTPSQKLFKILLIRGSSLFQMPFLRNNSDQAPPRNVT